MIPLPPVLLLLVVVVVVVNGRVFYLLVKHAAEYRFIPPGALRTYWLCRVSVSLQNGMVNCFYKHVGRANTPSFYDECLGQGVVLAQSHVGSVSVCAFASHLL
jgi:hypothetical protein